MATLKMRTKNGGPQPAVVGMHGYVTDYFSAASAAS